MSTDTLFDGYTAQDLAEHAEAHPDTEPMILDFSFRDEAAFIATVRGMSVAQIQWSFQQDERVYDDVEYVHSKGDYNGYYLKVESLVVASAFRRRGIAQLLFERFTEHADKHHGFVNGPGSGWDPGTFTADGAAFYRAVTGTEVPVTSRIEIG